MGLKNGYDFTEICHHHGFFGPIEFPSLGTNQPDPLMQITRSKLFGQWQIGQFIETNHFWTYFANGDPIRTKTFERLANPSECMVQWSPLSKKSLENAISSGNPGSFVGRTFYNKEWIPCKISRQSKRQIWACVGVVVGGESPSSIVIKDLDRFQILRSVPKPSTFSITNVTVLDTNWPNSSPVVTRSIATTSIENIRNKADVKVTNTVTERHMLEKSSSKLKTTLLELDIDVLKDTFWLDVDLSNTTTTRKMNRKFIEVRRSVIIPERTSIQSCTVLEITNSPIETSFELVPDGLERGIYGNAVLADDSVDLTFAVIPGNSFISCEQFVLNGSSYRYDENLDLEDFYDYFKF